MKTLFGMERLPPYSPVHRSVQGKLLAKVPVLWQTKADACYTMKSKRNVLACFYNENNRSTWQRCVVQLCFVLAIRRIAIRGILKWPLGLHINLVGFWKLISQYIVGLKKPFNSDGTRFLEVHFFFCIFTLQVIFHIFLFKVILVMHNTTTTSPSTPASTGKVIIFFFFSLTWLLITKQLSMFFLSYSIVSTVKPQMCACATFFSEKNILSVFLRLTNYNWALSKINQL